MKNLFLIVFAAASLFSCQKELDFGAGAANQAPEITSNTVINSLQPNTQRNGYMLDSGIIAVPQAGVDLYFGYDTVPMTQTWSDSIKTPLAVPEYPAASYMTGVNIDALGQTIAANEYYELNNTKWSDLGTYLGTDVNINLMGFGVIINRQAIEREPAQTLVNFPIRYADSLSQTTTSSFTMTVSGTFSGFPINGPIDINTTTTVASKNIAYGIMDLNGYADSLEVVVQQYTTNTTTEISSTDILINTVLDAALTQLGIDNNQTISNTVYRYWAKNKGLVMTRENNGMAFVRTGL